MSVPDTNTILSLVVSSEYLQSVLFSQIIVSVPVVSGVYVLDKLETMNSSVVPISNYNQSPYTNLQYPPK